jgi:NTP pyrophosphatase (non-canonical NTP hydrolase)
MSLLTLDQYQRLAGKTDWTRDTNKPADLPLLGLFGEVGSLMSEVKKKQRDVSSSRSYVDTVLEELGDVLWYLSTISDRYGVPLSAVANTGMASFGLIAPQGGLTFASLQAQQPLPFQYPTRTFEYTLMQLAAATGKLLQIYEAGPPTGGMLILSLHEVFTSLLHAVNEAHVSMEDAAKRNLVKIHDRWPVDRKYPHHFDARFPPEERIPRQLTIDIFEREVNGKTYVLQRCNGVLVGDRVLPRCFPLLVCNISWLVTCAPRLVSPEAKERSSV